MFIYTIIIYSFHFDLNQQFESLEILCCIFQLNVNDVNVVFDEYPINAYLTLNIFLLLIKCLISCLFVRGVKLGPDPGSGWFWSDW